MKAVIFFCLSFILTNSDVISQPQIPVNQIDSLFQKNTVSNKDWTIALSIFEGGTVPIYDSLGNSLFEDLSGTFLLSKFQDNYYLQKIWNDYTNVTYEPKLIFGDRIKLSNDFNYTSDSIKLADNECIYPFIYRNDSLDVYGMQFPSSHDTYYGLYFKTAGLDGYSKLFTNTDLTEKVRFLNYVNVNYKHNVNTFINRAFITVIALAKNNNKLWTK